MIYQLPNGKVVHITIEQYLDMDDSQFNTLIQNSPSEEPPQRNQSNFSRCYKPSLAQKTENENEIEFTDTKAPIRIEDIPDERIN